MYVCMYESIVTASFLLGTALLSPRTVPHLMGRVRSKHQISFWQKQRERERGFSGLSHCLLVVVKLVVPVPILLLLPLPASKSMWVSFLT